jgi:hypothetical protein
MDGVEQPADQLNRVEQWMGVLVPAMMFLAFFFLFLLM